MNNRDFQYRRVLLLLCGLSIGLSLAQSAFAQAAGGEKRAVASGEQLKLKGVVLKRDGETLVLRDEERKDTVVLLTDNTVIKTTRKGVFRGGKSYGVTSILQGLILQGEGTGDSQGRLVADDIRFTEEDLKAAITASVRVSPVEQKSDAALQGVAANRQNIDANKAGIDATNKRISALDEWDAVKTVEVYFAVNSTALSSQARATLDELGPKAREAKDYKVEVAGFADSTGNPDKNIELSHRRADAVVQYLVVKYDVPLRRISTPIGYGATHSVADNTDQQGRAKNRRVEVKVLVNKAMLQK